jgi:hypothetical protein
VLGPGKICAVATIFELIWPGIALSQAVAPATPPAQAVDAPPQPPPGGSGDGPPSSEGGEPPSPPAPPPAPQLPENATIQPQPLPGNPPPDSSAPAQVSPAASRQNGVFLALPYLGAESHRAQSGRSFGVGFLAGALFGARIGNKFSLNGELAIDVVNVKSAPTGTKASRREVDLAISPLYHLGARGVEVVVGPKLGLWFGSYQLTSAGRTLDSESARGLVGALNLGVFLPVTRGMSLGGMLSVALKTFGRTCATPVGQTETCNPSPNLDSEKVLGFTGAALF